MNDDIRFAYRENTARLATPVGRVVLLYEQMIQDIGQAIAAVQRQHIEDRTRAINHALLVLGLLQGSLDLERGGDVARNLDRFYQLVRARLMEAQVRASGAILEDQRNLLLSLRAAWLEVERAAGPAAPETAASPASVPASAENSPKNWSA
jgi:flagellar protein FliS